MFKSPPAIHDATSERYKGSGRPGELLRTAIMAALIAFSIPEGSLVSSIVEFARQANVQIIVAVRPLEGRRAASVYGLIPPQQALDSLLAPSGCKGLIQDRLIRLRCPATIAIS